MLSSFHLILFYLISNFILIFCHPGEMKIHMWLQTLYIDFTVLRVLPNNQWSSSSLWCLRMIFELRRQNSQNQDLVLAYNCNARLHTLPGLYVFILCLWFHSNFCLPLYFRIVNILILCFLNVSARNWSACFICRAEIL